MRALEIVKEKRGLEYDLQKEQQEHSAALNEERQLRTSIVNEIAALFAHEPPIQQQVYRAVDSLIEENARVARHKQAMKAAEGSSGNGATTAAAAAEHGGAQPPPPSNVPPAPRHNLPHNNNNEKKSISTTTATTTTSTHQPPAAPPSSQQQQQGSNPNNTSDDIPRQIGVSNSSRIVMLQHCEERARATLMTDEKVRRRHVEAQITKCQLLGIYDTQKAEEMLAGGPDFPIVAADGSRGGAFMTPRLAEPLNALQQLYVDKCRRANVAPNLPLLQTLPSEATLVTSLDLSRTYLGKRGAQCLMDILPSCTNLRSLNFADNKMDNDAVLYLVSKIQKLTNLEVLSLKNNLCSKAGAKALLQLVQNKPSIKQLDISGMPFLMGVMRDRIIQQVETNQALAA
eukprot:TRINITY_DN57664_c0_g1_i1.p2 TRINITY_DN57664_c0_g1~~TRINITY_DN57664_c0_g1_i1.p2  ORF type:complete len:412 (-),score=57.52 TRINITY_DN57664_c0_g1_i1:1596-2795(-)